MLPVASICSLAPEVVPVIQKPFSPTLLCEKRALVHSTRPLLKTSKVASLTSSVYAHDEITGMQSLYNVRNAFVPNRYELENNILNSKCFLPFHGVVQMKVIVLQKQLKELGVAFVFCSLRFYTEKMLNIGVG